MTHSESILLELSSLSSAWKEPYLDLASIEFDKQLKQVTFSVDHCGDTPDYIKRYAMFLQFSEYSIYRDSATLTGVSSVTVKAKGEKILIVQNILMNGQKIQLDGSNGSVIIDFETFPIVAECKRVITSRKSRHFSSALFDYCWESTG